MKFWLELVSCCGSCSRGSAVAKQRPAGAVEETRSLVGAVARRNRGRKRGRARLGGGGGSSSVSDWRPSLSSISEDGVLAERNRDRGGDRSMKRKVVNWSSSSSSGDDSHSRRCRDHGGRASLSTIIPAFSPTPFMF